MVARDSKLLFEALNRGDGDLVAAQLAAALSEEEVLMTASLYSTAPVVVQRGVGSPAAGASGTVKRATARERRETDADAITIRARLISRPSELAGQQVHVAKVTPYRRRLLELNVELADDIDVVEVDETTDKLIERLAEGDIAFTVAAENVAALRTGEYANLIIMPAIGPPQPVVWALRRSSPLLHDALNQWIAVKRHEGLLDVLYRKYFLDRRGYHRRVASRYLTGETGHLSPYDDAFRSARIPVGRRMVPPGLSGSALDPRARSWAGPSAMRYAAHAHGCSRPRNPSRASPALPLPARIEQAWRNTVHRRADA